MTTASTNMLQLPVATGLDGTETLWIVQGGTDKRATTGQVATEGQEIPTNAPIVLSEVYGFLPSGRVLAGASGIVALTDGGAGTTLTISLVAAGVWNLINAPRTVTDGGNITVAVDDLVIYIRQTVAAAVDVLLPAASTKVGPVYIVDANGVAASNNYRLVPNGAETIVGLSEYLISTNYQSVMLRPVSGVGWVL